jgi:hypothetical protein
VRKRGEGGREKQDEKQQPAEAQTQEQTRTGEGANRDDDDAVVGVVGDLEPGGEHALVAGDRLAGQVVEHRELCGEPVILNEQEEQKRKEEGRRRRRRHRRRRRRRSRRRRRTMSIEQNERQPNMNDIRKFFSFALISALLCLLFSLLFSLFSFFACLLFSPLFPLCLPYTVVRFSAGRIPATNRWSRISC